MISHKRIIFVLSVTLSCLGLIELVENSLIEKSSELWYKGGFLCGLFCIITGLCGIKCYMDDEYKCLTCCLISATIASLFAAKNQKSSYMYASDVQSCSQHGGNGFNSYAFCYGAPSTACYGNSDFFQASMTCWDKFNTNYQDCVCVTQNNLECYNYGLVENCESFVDVLPFHLMLSYWVAVLSLIISVGLFVPVAIALKRQRNQNTDDGYRIVAPISIHDEEGL